MAIYTIENIAFSNVTAQQAVVSYEVHKDGLLLTSSTYTVRIRDDVKEMAEDIETSATVIAQTDFNSTDLLVQVKAILEGKELAVE